jgi:TonB family protein
LHAALLAGLWQWTQQPVPAADAPAAMTIVALLPPAPPAPPSPPAMPQARSAPSRAAPAARRAAPAVSAPAAGATAAAADGAQQATGTVVSPAYFGTLEALIRRTLVYPPGSLARSEEGICKVLVSFSRDGAIHGARLVQDSGHGALDEECREVFRRIGRFPPVPPDTSPSVSDFSIELPISYSLQ